MLDIGAIGTFPDRNVSAGNQQLAKAVRCPVVA
jgi:hypothetical protein